VSELEDRGPEQLKLDRVHYVHSSLIYNSQKLGELRTGRWEWVGG
jgi:hypothetical protein